MAAPAFQRVEQLFHEAAQLPPEGRSAFLDRACAGDRALRIAVEDLLRHDDATNATDGFLVSPVTLAAEQYRPTHPAPPSPPTIERPNIPGYDILDDLGRGGMGVVFKARQVSLNRIVALKILLPTALISTEQLDRFRTEAELLARIHQPNIVSIYDIGAYEGRPYFTMEFVEGPNLAQYLRGRPQDPVAAARLIEVLARAIQTVHDCGVIHRDLKPANILLEVRSERLKVKGENQSPNGFHLLTLNLSLLTPKVTDFGLAKDWTAGRELTQAGMAMGTPNYMAPEQARCRPWEVGPAADTYALGAILYELLTGRPPFDAATPAETINLLLSEDPLPPARLRGGLPRDLATICLKCLEKAPRQRYSTAAALAEDLSRFCDGEPITARPIGIVDRSVRWCRRRPLVASLASLLALLSVAFVVTVLVYNRRLADAVEQQRQQIIHLNINIGVTELARGDTFTALLRFVEALRLDPHDEQTHRNRIAATLGQCPCLAQHWQLERPILCARAINSHLWIAALNPDNSIDIRELNTDRQIGPRVQLPDPPRAGSLSADGRWLATLKSEGVVQVWDLQSKEPVSHVLPGTSAAQRIGFDFAVPLLMVTHIDSATRYWDLNSGKPVLRDLGSNSAILSDDTQWTLALDHPQRGQLVDTTKSRPTSSLKLLPDVNRAALSHRAEHLATIGTDQRVHVQNVATGESTHIPHQSNGNNLHLRFSPDGRRLIIIDDSGLARVWNTITAHPLTPPLRHDGALATVDFDFNGQQVIAVCRSGSVRIWDLNSNVPTLPNRPLDELLALAELLSHRRIDEDQHCVPLDPERLRTNLQRVKLKN